MDASMAGGLSREPGGTIYTMAPEVLLNKGEGLEWWWCWCCWWW
jgi:hypothetical protein